MPPINQGTFAKALWPGVRTWWGETYPEQDRQYPSVFEVVPSNKAFEEEVGETGLGLAQVMGDGEPVPYDTMQQGYTKRYTMVKYGLGFIVTKDEYDDNQYPALAKRRTKKLKMSMVQTQETIAANVLNYAFSSTRTGADGKELCATDHPHKTGGEYSNELSTAADLSESALEQMCINIAKFTNDRGLKIKIMPEKLIIPPDLEFEATRILKSLLQPGTANNDINALRVNGKIKNGMYVYHYLTDTDAWFVQTNCPDGLKYFDRRPLGITQDNDFDTENAKYKAIMRLAVGWTDPMGICGSPGV